MWLFLAFLLVPLIEIALFIQLGGLIGIWPTLAIVVATAVIGTWLVRAQGARAMADLRGSFSRLDDPSEALAHGAMILVSGALLLTPGFFTDAVGFALLAPPVRMAVFRWARSKVKVARFDMGGAQAHQWEGPSRAAPSGPSAGGSTKGPARGNDVIDGEFSEIPQDKPANHPGSGWTRH